MAYKKSNANGQAAMAASEPVVIASDQSAVPVSFTGSTDVATQTTLAAINTKLTTGTDIGDVTINNAGAGAAVNIQDGGNTITVDGAVTVTNAIATNLKAEVIALGAIAHDSADAGNPLKIGGRASTTPVTAVAANDRVDAFFDVQGRQVVTNKALTGTITSVNSSATNVTLLAANTARLGATFLNLSTATLYLKLGATATATTSYTVKMLPNAYYEIPFGYYGIVDGIWSAANGYCNVTEIS